MYSANTQNFKLSPSLSFSPHRGSVLALGRATFGEVVMEQVCIKCGESLPASSYHKGSKSKSGLQSSCKSCRKKYSANNAKHINDYNRDWRKRNPQKAYISTNKWRNANRVKISCYKKVSTALGNGSLIKEPCTICGSLKSEAHHEDYSKPLAVIWLCSKHHSERHTELRRITNRTPEKGN